jgi:AcrR family transcriptional regulator
VADICEAADIGRRTFFRYFASKEDLLGVPVQEMSARFASSLATVPVAFADGQAVRASMADLAGYVLTHRAQLDLYRRITTTSSTLRLPAFWHLPEHEQQFAQLLQDREGGTGEPDLVTRLLVARAVAAFRVWIDEALNTSTDADSDQHARRLFDQIFDADSWLAAEVDPGTAIAM